jgi:hypothetical protein
MITRLAPYWHPWRRAGYTGEKIVILVPTDVRQSVR